MREYCKCSRVEIEKDHPNGKDIDTTDKRGMATVQTNIQRKKSHNTILDVDAVFMAQMKGYSPWPSRISNINKKRVSVFFFGTSNTGTVDLSEIVPMDHCSNIIRLLLLRKTSYFLKGVLEAELCLGIPAEKSSTKTSEEIE